MRLLAATLITAAGAIVASVYPATVLLAVGVCIGTAVLLGSLAAQHPSIASLRQAAIGAGVTAMVALIIGVLIIYGDTPFEVRSWLRGLSLALVTLPALYWLICLATGGFDER